MFFRLRTYKSNEYELPSSIPRHPTPCSGNPWLQSIIDNAGQMKNNSSPTPKIQRVPQVLRNDKSLREHYNPLLVSLGPYHHGKPELQALQKFKVSVAGQFVLESKKPIDAFFEKVSSVSRRARSCYIDGSTDTYSDAAFTQMMFLDGCFILYMIDCIAHNKLEQKTMIVENLGFLTSTMMIPELFLLENQIPLFVIYELMSLRFEREEGEDMIGGFIDSIMPTFPQGKRGILFSKQPLHLLEFLRSRLLQENGGEDKDKDYLHALQQQKAKRKPHVLTEDYSSYLFHSVKELKSKGIHFEPSSTRCLNNVKFRSNYIYGHLTLPPRTIGPQTKQLFLNLVAYEMCPNTPNDMGITSYVYFINSLLNSPEDVTELRSQGIIINFLNSDKEVLEMFKEITAYAMHNTEAYALVKECIQQHCNSRMRGWMAGAIIDHFKNPWTVFTLLAATFVIALSACQTYFTLFPLANKCKC